MQPAVDPEHSIRASQPPVAELAEVLQASGVAALFEFQFLTNAMDWPFGRAGLYGRPDAVMLRLQDGLAAIARHMPSVVLFYRARHIAEPFQRRLSSRIVLLYDARGRPERMVGITLREGQGGSYSTWHCRGAPMTPADLLPHRGRVRCSLPRPACSASCGYGVCHCRPRKAKMAAACCPIAQCRRPHQQERNPWDN